MIFGYSRRKVNNYGLHELKEVTLAMGPAELRLLGRFLLDMADQMEAGAFDACSHRHLTSAHPAWSELHPSADVIVMPPEDGSAGGRG
jgi:hypothetical protein